MWLFSRSSEFLGLLWMMSLEDQLDEAEDLQGDGRRLAQQVVEFLREGSMPKGSGAQSSLANRFRMTLLALDPQPEDLDDFTASVGAYLGLGVLPTLSVTPRTTTAERMIQSVGRAPLSRAADCFHGCGPPAGGTRLPPPPPEAVLSLHDTLKMKYCGSLVQTIWALVRCCLTCRLPREVCRDPALARMGELCGLWVAVTRDIFAHARGDSLARGEPNLVEILMGREGGTAEAEAISRAVAMANSYKEQIAQDVAALRGRSLPAGKQNAVDGYLDAVLHWSEGFFFLHLDGIYNQAGHRECCGTHPNLN